MRTPRLKAPLAASATLLMAAPALASVTYTFTAVSALQGPTGSFSYTSPTFISSDLIVNPAQLDSCTVSAGTCFSENFSFTDAPGYDLVEFGYNDGSSDSRNYYYFNSSSFGAVGTYGTSLLSGLQDGTLTVSQTVDAVPEPSTWAMFLLGFAAMGIAIRRHGKGLPLRQGRLNRA